MNGRDGRFIIMPYRLENPAEGEMLHYYHILSTQSWYMIRAASYEDGERSLINLTDTIYATDLVSPEDRDLIFYGKSTSGVESISRNDSALRSVHTSSGMMFSVDGDCIQSVAVI